MKIKEIAIINPSSKDKYFDYINYIDTSSVFDGKLLNTQFLSKSYPSRAQRKIKYKDILISSVRPNLLHNYYVTNEIDHGIASTGFIQVRVESNKYIPRFVYYFLTSKKNISKYSSIADASQTTFPTFNKDIIENLEIPDYDINKQHYIVDIIGSIDDKIENNNKIIEKMNEFMMLIFKKIYNKALKSNNSVHLEDIVDLKTGKKDANAASKQGNYPFFTCSENNSRINEYSFDREAILIAGNGNMSVKYYKGKFDAYQRTYVIGSKKYFYYLYLYYKNFIKDISVGARGSVIKFLTKSMLVDIDMPIASDDEMANFEKNIKNVLNYTMSLEIENEKLNKLKQNYLLKFF